MNAKSGKGTTCIKFNGEDLENLESTSIRSANRRQHLQGSQNQNSKTFEAFNSLNIITTKIWGKIECLSLHNQLKTTKHIYTRKTITFAPDSAQDKYTPGKQSHTQAQAQIHIHSHTQTQRHTDIDTHPDTCSHTRPCAQLKIVSTSGISSQLSSLSSAFVPFLFKNLQTHTQTHTHRHTHTHTHTHTHVRARNWIFFNKWHQFSVVQPQ